MTVSVEDIEKKVERKRKYAELFKEKQQQQLDKPAKKPFEPTVICHFFVEGRCTKGDKCTFIHKPERKLELCKFYQGGYCSKSDKCFFMHADFPCKFFHAGKKTCLHGDKCRFSHEPIVDVELREAFERYSNQDPDAVAAAASMAAAGAVIGNGGGAMMNTMNSLKMTSLLGSPPHYLKDSSLPSLMNLAVKPAANSPSDNDTVASIPTTTDIVSRLRHIRISTLLSQYNQIRSLGVIC